MCCHQTRDRRPECQVSQAGRCDEEAAGDELEEAIESSLTDTDETPVDYDTFEELRISNRQIRYISNLARKNDYRIPYVKNGKAGLINLTFLSDSSDKGKISINPKRGKSHVRRQNSHL